MLYIKSTTGHLLHKRQASQDDICNAVVTREICTNGYYEDYAYVITRCGQYSTARSIQNACRSNSVGTFCGSIDFDSEMFDAVCGGSTTTCSTECMDLLNTTRTEAGCCVKVLNDTSFQPVLSYSLWSLCGVEPVTEDCGPSPFDLPSERDPTCTLSNFLTPLYSRVLCRAEFLVSIRNALLATPGCESAADQYSNSS